MWLWSSNQAFGHLGCPSLIILFFLREDKMRKKLFLALIALTACCGYGCAEDEGGATCTDGERRCYGEHSQVCKDGAYTTEKCTMGCDAVSGKCNTSPATPEICADGKFQCADGKLEKCVSNAWVKQEECPADRCDATAGKCNTDNPPADKCTNDTFKCENEKLYKCENESWNAGTACPAAKCHADTGKCDEEQPQLEKCTATSTKKCEATCNSDKKEGYYWGGKNAVKVNCSNNNCYASSDKAFVGCGTEVPYCEAGSNKACQKKCLDDGSKGYYWGNKKINEYVCVNNDCMISSNNRVACVSDEPADTKAACSGDGKVSCENSNMMVKYCDAKTNTYWTKRCAQCTVNEKSTAYYCDGKIPCKKGGKTKCVNSCDPNDPRKHYDWNKNKVEEKSCGVNQVCKDIEGGIQCVKK